MTYKIIRFNEEEGDWNVGNPDVVAVFDEEGRDNEDHALEEYDNLLEKEFNVPQERFWKEDFDIIKEYGADSKYAIVVYDGDKFEGFLC